jgi:hypothetical protein
MLCECGHPTSGHEGGTGKCLYCGIKCPEFKAAKPAQELFERIGKATPYPD